MPWNAIAYVSSGLTLAAFIVAVVAWVIRSRILAREVSIRSAIENKQNDLIERTLEYFDVDTRGLTRKQKFELAMEQIRARARRFLITMIAVIVVAFLAAGVSIFAIMRATLPISGKSDEDGNRNTPNNTNNVPNVNSFTPTPANNTTATPKPFPSITNGNNAPAGNNAQPIPSPALQNDVRSIQYLACDKEWDFDSIVKSGSYDWFKYSTCEK